MKNQKPSLKIFLASSNEMKADRNDIERLIRSKNSDWQKLGRPYLDLEIWEDESEAMSRTRSQDEYNKIIPTVDIFVMLFWHKVGKFTNEEFEIAQAHFLQIGKPTMLVYKKACPEDELEQTAKDFQAALFKEDEEYFHGNYDHFDTLALKLHKEIDRFYEQHKEQFALENPQGKTINQQADKIYNIDNIDNATFN
ncbi:MAG: hypothetical protein AAF789_13740 [Bacteroidota bacterium]